MRTTKHNLIARPYTAQIDEEIAALEQAIRQLQQSETLRGILKSVVSEVI